MFSLGLALGAMFLWLALKDVDFNSISSTFQQAKLWYCLPFLLALGLFYWLKAIRWSSLLNPVRHIPAKELVPSMIVGFAGNNVFPMRLGELIRMYLLSQETDIPKSTVLATIALERLFDAFSILIILTAAMYFSPMGSLELEVARNFLFLLSMIALFTVYAIVYTPLWLSKTIGPLLKKLPTAILKPAIEKSQYVRQGFSSLRGYRAVISIFVNSLAQWVTLTICILLAIEAFAVNVPVLASALVLGLVVAGISLPSAPGFVGTMEYCFVLGLGFFGVAANEALAVAIFYHALTFGSVTIGGVFFFRKYNQSWTELRLKSEGLNNPRK